MGVVTEHFYGMVSQRQAEAERNQIVQLVETYFADVDTSLTELSGHVDNSEVDFSVLASLARGIEDKSARIGAEHMRLACSDIIQACDQKNKNRFCETLPWLKNEFTHTRRKLSAYLEMENEIIRHESSQPPN